MPLIPVRPKTWLIAKVTTRRRRYVSWIPAARHAWYAVLALTGAIAVLAGLAGYVVTEMSGMATPVQAIGQGMSAEPPLPLFPSDSRHGQPEPTATRVPVIRKQKLTPTARVSPPHHTSPQSTAPVPAAPSPACQPTGGCGGDGWHGGWYGSGYGGWDSGGWHSGGWYGGDGWHGGW
jgi:uncharacterized membrane protein YgcG